VLSGKTMDFDGISWLLGHDLKSFTINTHGLFDALKRFQQALAKLRIK
jgi:hypothetical protein